MTTTTAFDTTALSTAIETRSAGGQLAAYAADAELVIIDHEHPPTSPRVLRGSAAIDEYLQDVCSRDMTHAVTNAVVAGDRLTVEVDCRYADGTRVACLSIAGIEAGRISWQRLVQAWDH